MCKDRAWVARDLNHGSEPLEGTKVRIVLYRRERTDIAKLSEVWSAQHHSFGCNFSLLETVPAFVEEVLNLACPSELLGGPRNETDAFLYGEPLEVTGRR